MNRSEPWCPNFRDVGELVNIIAEEKIICERILFRGGRIDFIHSLEEVGAPQTIINLRKGPDPAFPAKQFHFPAQDDVENYDSSNRHVQRWIISVIEKLAEDECPVPILIHCASGRDRTGIVVASLLLAIGVPAFIVEDEYLFSEGTSAENFNIFMNGSETLLSLLSPNLLKKLTKRFSLAMKNV